MAENISVQNNAENANIPPPVNAEAIVTVLNSGLTASLRIKPPENGGADLTYDQLKEVLAKNGIVFGIIDTVLRFLANRPMYNNDTVVARGVTGTNGEDAQLIYHVEMNRELKPKEKENGIVDFKDLGIIQEVKKGALLCEKKPLSEGIPGTDVKGNTISALPGKDKNIIVGKNTVLSEDRLKLLSEVDGHVSVINGKINVLNVFVVQGNVSAETGNINFIGNVVVKGDVVQGFSIQAAGDVTVDGVIEGAKITAGGSLIVRGGFRGGDNGELDIGGDIACNFIEGGQVKLRGDLETTYIMNAIVKCGGSVHLNGKGMIRGGYVTARKEVTANYLGTENTALANTVIEVGNDPVMAERFRTLAKEAEPYEKNIENLEALISSFTKLKEAGQLTRDKEDRLEKATDYLEKIRESYAEISDEYTTLKQQIAEAGYGTVSVQKSAYPGLKIIIGPDSLVLQSVYSYTIFSRSDKGVVFAPLR